MTAGSEGGARDAIQRLGGHPASPYEGRFGFSRVVRLGSIVLVGGTTAIDEDGVVRGETPYEQTVIVLEKIGQELARAGAISGSTRPEERAPEPEPRAGRRFVRYGSYNVLASPFPVGGSGFVL